MRKKDSKSNSVSINSIKTSQNFIEISRVYPFEKDYIMLTILLTMIILILKLVRSTMLVRFFCYIIREQYTWVRDVYFKANTNCFICIRCTRRIFSEHLFCLWLLCWKMTLLEKRKKELITNVTNSHLVKCDKLPAIYYCFLFFFSFNFCMFLSIIHKWFFTSTLLSSKIYFSQNLIKITKNYI